MFINSRKGFTMSRIGAIGFKGINTNMYPSCKNKQASFGQEAIAIPARVAARSSFAMLAASAIFMRNKIAASKLYRNMEILALQLSNTIRKSKGAAASNFKKQIPEVPKFLDEEKVIIAKYKKHTGNEDRIFAILQGHGLNDESLKYIKETSGMMQSKSKSAMSLRDHLKIALNKETPLEVIEDLLTRSAMYRKIWKLDLIPQKNNTELANLLLNRKVLSA